MASRDYKSLEYEFKINENQTMIKYIVGILLLPLQDDRKLVFDYIENIKELIDFYSPPLNSASLIKFANDNG